MEKTIRCDILKEAYATAYSLKTTTLMYVEDYSIRGFDSGFAG